MVLLSASFFLFYSYCNSQDLQTTPNLIQQYGWQGCLTTHSGIIQGDTVDNHCPVQRTTDGAILFSHKNTTLSQTIAINTALSGTGIQIRGYDYSWTIKNANAGAPQQSHQADPLQITVNLTNKNDQVIESKTHDYGFRIFDWTTYSGTEIYQNIYNLIDTKNITVFLRGQDIGNRAEYYGPEIRNIDIRLRYSVDQCQTNPLSSPECLGYKEAYKNQQCSINPLYDWSCAGYQEAFFQQQCVNNPLISTACPGYAAAFLQQQCNLDPLYNSQCPGYAEAYRTKLYSTACQVNSLSLTGCKNENTKTSESTTDSQMVVTVIADPVKSATEIPLVNDLVVNQVITSKTEIIDQALGQGLQIHNFLTNSRSQIEIKPTRTRSSVVSIRNRNELAGTANENFDIVNRVEGFDAYTTAQIPDNDFYATREIYKNVRIRDNERAERALSLRNDRLHREMINEQYR